MTSDDLVTHLRDLGWTVERIADVNGQPYLVIRGYQIPAGSLAGEVCDLAIQETRAVPYVAPSAIHTRPALVPMDMGRYRTQSSAIGPEWQYWSRVLRGQPSPRGIVAHFATIFSEV